MGGTCCVMQRDKLQVGRSILNMPFWQVNKIMQAIEECEEVLKSPPTCLEVYAHIIKEEMGAYVFVKSGFDTEAILLSLLREDRIATDALCTKFTVNLEAKGYQTFSQLFKSNFTEGYKIDDNNLAEVTTAKTVKFEDHLKLLKSKDAENYQTHEALFNGEFRFLDKA